MSINKERPKNFMKNYCFHIVISNSLKYIKQNTSLQRISHKVWNRQIPSYNIHSRKWMILVEKTSWPNYVLNLQGGGGVKGWNFLWRNYSRISVVQPWKWLVIFKSFISLLGCIKMSQFLVVLWFREIKTLWKQCITSAKVSTSILLELLRICFAKIKLSD